MKRSQIPLILLLIWFGSMLYLLLGAIVFNRASWQSILLIVSSQVLQMAVILPCVLVIFPKYWKRNTLPQLIGCIGGLLLAFVLTRYLLEEIVFVHWFGLANNEGVSLPFFLYENIYYSFPGVFIGFIIFLLTKSYTTEYHNQQLSRELRQAELSLLRLQLNPHFLYNTLNYIYAMALPIPGPLAQAVMKLSKTLQYTLAKNRNDLVALSEEMQFIQDYLSLHVLRFSPTFQYNLLIQGDIEAIQLPPLLLLPFIENALKHGVTNDPTAAVLINLAIGDSQLTFHVANRINRQSQVESTGIGLENVKRRLILLYPGRYTLSIKSEGETFHSSLTLSL
jgi:two-component system LytT family sensor kinase